MVTQFLTTLSFDNLHIQIGHCKNQYLLATYQFPS